MSAATRTKRDDTIKRLTVLLARDYADSVAKKEATEFDSSNCTGRTTAKGGIFSSIPRCTSYGAAVVGRLRPAGYLVHRSVNPAICRSSPFDSGLSGFPTAQGGHHA